MNSSLSKIGYRATQVMAIFLFVAPLLWLVAASLHPQGAPLPTSLKFWPAKPSLANFVRVWQLVPLGQYTLNSILVVIIAVPITLLSSSWAGFGMARLPLKSQRRWVFLSLAILMVPGMALWFTRFLLYKQWGIVDTRWALIVPAFMGTSPFYVLMFYRAFRRIPTAVYEATRLDGAGVLQTWALVAMPLARPTVIGVGLLSFIFYWGDFISPLLYLSRETLYTLPIALQLLQQLSRSDWSLLMAAAMWASLCPILLFLLLQPYFYKATTK